MTFEVREIDLFGAGEQAQHWIDVQTRSGEAVWGSEHSGWSLGEVQGRRRGTQHTFIDLAAIEGDAVIGMAAVAMPAHDNKHLALLMLHVDPDHRKKGVGMALAQDVLRRIGEAGRTTVQVDTETPTDAEDSVGPDFAERFGFSNVQTLFRSAMPLPADRDRLAGLAAGEGIEDAAAFRVEWRVDDVPDEWLPGLAILEQRMSTDAHRVT